jgi:2-dehydropantoate 2-reductase
VSQNIVMIGAGAVGSYVGGHLAEAGANVTLLDQWHDNIEAIRAHGLHVSGMTSEEERIIRPATMHLNEAASLANRAPVDIAIVSVKSYDTEWATTLIRPYLAPAGFVVSLQNCINEERIAAVVGWGRTVGCIASRISVELYEPGKVRRQSPKGRAGHHVFRVGEVHGRVTERAAALAELLGKVDSAVVTTNLWGERWSKLAHNAMRNGLSAVTGVLGRDIDQDVEMRRLTIRLGAEAVRVGRALGYDIEPVGKLDPGKLQAAGEGDAAALAGIEALLLEEGAKGTRGALQRPSTGQDIVKGRRTEIDFINGYVANKGDEIGVPAPLNRALTRLVKRIERGELAPARDNIRLLDA